jgi:hypothetical protein
MGNFKTVVLKPKPCCYCGRPAVRGRAWCSPCLARVRLYGCCDLPEYPSREDSERAKEPEITFTPWRTKRAMYEPA